MGRNRRRDVVRKRQLSVVVRCFCEGETESEYIKGFIKGKNKHYKFQPVVCQDPQSIYDRHKAELKANKDNIHVLIFDNDNRSMDRLSKIMKKAKNEGALIYYSNLCFELWFLQILSNYSKRVDKPKMYYRELEKTLGIDNYSGFKGSKIIELLSKREDFEINNEIYMKKIDNLNEVDEIDKILEQNPYTNICFLEHDIERYSSINKRGE